MFLRVDAKNFRIIIAQILPQINSGDSKVFVATVKFLL